MSIPPLRCPSSWLDAASLFPCCKSCFLLQIVSSRAAPAGALSLFLTLSCSNSHAKFSSWPGSCSRLQNVSICPRSSPIYTCGCRWQEPQAYLHFLGVKVPSNRRNHSRYPLFCVCNSLKPQWQQLMRSETWTRSKSHYSHLLCVLTKYGSSIWIMIHMLVSAPISFCIGCKCSFLTKYLLIFFYSNVRYYWYAFHGSSFGQTDGDYNWKIPTIHMVLLDGTYVYISWILIFSV